MSGFSWSTEEQDSETEKHEYEGTTKNTTYSTLPDVSGQPDIKVMEANDDSVPEVEISAGQKMLSAGYGSLLTAVLGEQYHISCLNTRLTSLQ